MVEIVCTSPCTSPSEYTLPYDRGGWEGQAQPVLCSGAVGTLHNLAMPSNHSSPKLGEVAQGRRGL